MSYQRQLDELRSCLIVGAKRFAAALHRARTQQVDMAILKASFASSLDRLRELAKRDQKISLNALRPWVQQHGKKLAIRVGALIAAILAIFLVNLLSSIVSNSVALKPAQLTAIESLIQDSKNTGSSPSQAPPLTDNDLETMRVILQNRGITSNILRLNLDSGIGIEIQTDQAAFGQWIAFLEEIRQRWQVYPAQLTLKSTDQPEIVSIRGTLQQTQTAAP
jgi:type II secretory pathway component PulM